ncbi:MAG: hypothetical protein GDA39_10090 [Hyphomonadaceae bacterium]|nr:hypothetical protein [Hyphomonadaceae bacterium]MBC6413182.1 hypothetical protein [Hyphomonadaceae bacterium]
MNIETPPPDSGEPPKWKGDSSATEEDRCWSNEKKIQDARVSADVRWARVYGIVAVVFLVVLSLLFLSALVVWAAHYLLPMDRHWLTEGQLSKLQSVISGGGLGSVLSILVQRQLSK